MSYDIEQFPVAVYGSVKNIRVVTEPTDDKMGEYIFQFTDDTSVKDRGKLGFATPNKGASMCATAVYNFYQLQHQGIPTLFREQVADDAILVRSVRVINPDEVDIRGMRKNLLFPVEVITRDVVTATSSARKRLDDGSLHYSALGLDSKPTEYPVFLPKTFVDGSTKLRSSGDAYLSWSELKDLACATTGDMNTIDAYIRRTTAFGMRRGAEIGFLKFDQKDEYAYDPDGNIVVADVPLCLDEITGALVGRFDDLDAFRGKPFKVFQPGKVHDDDAHVNASKQIYRDHFDAKHPEWVRAVKAGLPEEQPKAELPATPQVPEELIMHGSNIYTAFANEWTGKQTFAAAPSLADAVAGYKRWAQGYYELR